MELILEQATDREADYARRAVEAAIAARDAQWRASLEAAGARVTYEPTPVDAHEIAAPPPPTAGYL